MALFVRIFTTRRTHTLPKIHCQPGSMIDELSVVTNESGGVRAYLHAADGVTREQLLRITKAFESKYARSCR